MTFPSGEAALQELRTTASPIREFVLDSWYAVAFSNEVVADKILSRRCCNLPIALFRSEGGAPVALFDRCPHRGVPLTQGAVKDGAIQCAYHGMAFGASGACIRIPGQEQIPAQMRVPSYPVVEKGGFVWLWAGAKEAADPALLPADELLGLHDPSWSVTPYLMIEIQSNYAMLFENLLDTTHVSFLHGTAIDTGNVASSNFSAEFTDRSAHLVRDMKGLRPNASMALQYGLTEGALVDRHLTSASYLPNLHLIINRFTFPEDPSRAPHIRINVMPITPATSSSLYQFLTMASSYQEPHVNAVREGMRAVLTEDKVALEAIQRLYDEFGPDLPECSVRADVAALRARRSLRLMSEAGRSAA